MGLTIDGTDVTVEIAPDDTLWAVSPTWVDISDSVRSIPIAATSGRTPAADVTQPGQLEVVVDNRDRAFDMAYGPARVTFDGSGGDYWSCPDDAGFAGAGALDVRVAVALDDWTPAAAQVLMGQFGAGGARSWAVYIDTTGYLALNTSTDGTAVVGRNSGAVVSGVNGQVMCVRVTWDNSSGTTTYYIKRTTAARCVADCQSDNGWTQLGTPDTGVTHSLFNSAAVIAVGSDSTGVSPVDGEVYYAQAAVTVGGTPECTFWPADAASAVATSWVSSAASGETWTKTGSSTVHVQGAYYNRLTPGTPIRVYATRSGTDYPLWYGYVRRVSQEYAPAGVDAQARITATDGIGWLQDIAGPSSPAMFDVFGMTGSAWPMHEDPATPTAADVLGNSPGVWSGPRTAGNATQSGAPSMTGSRLLPGKYLTALEPLAITLADCYIGFEVYMEDPASTWRVLWSDGTTTVGICYGVNGEYYTQDGTGVNRNYFATRIPAGRHTVGAYVSGAGGAFANGNMVVDDEVLGASGATGSLVSTPGALFVDGNLSTVSDVYVASNLHAVNLYEDGGLGQTAGERAAALLQTAGVWDGLDGTLIDVTTVPSTYLGAVATGVSFGENMAQTAAAERGRWFANPDGTLTFRSRNWDITDSTATTSQATFGEDDVPYAGIVVLPVDRADVVNDVTVTLPAGGSGRATDTESIAAYGRRTLSVTAPLASADAATAMAADIVARKAWPKVRVSQLTLKPTAGATVWTQVLTRGIGERITVQRDATGTLIPATTTDPIAVDVTVEQMTHSIDRNMTWTTTWQLAEAQPTAAEAGYFTLDDPVLGRLDAGIRFAP